MDFKECTAASIGDASVTIVAELARASGAEVSLARRDPRGLIATITFDRG